MDPYLEPHWLDVHSALVIEARRALNRTLPSGLVARVEERVAIESEEGAWRAAGPDVRVFAPAQHHPTEAQAAITLDAPYRLVVELDPVIERFIRVLDDSGELITVIEFLSPTNKRVPGLEDYRQKRAAMLSGGVHVVEIDLVRQGNWRALMRPATCLPDAISLYRATVRVAPDTVGGSLYPIDLRHPLPEIQIPLRPSDQPLRLPLQPLLDTVYADGRYDQTIDYAKDPDPPLDDADAAWADQTLRAAGRR
jgi:hypothetical protein